MAIVLEANYSKKLGLPGYSSHQYSLTIRTELNDLAHLAAESARLHTTLQDSVDREIRKTGFLPEGIVTANGGHDATRGSEEHDRWQCSDRQRDLILKIADEHQLEESAVDQLARDRLAKVLKR